MSFGGNVLNGTFWYFLVAPAKTRICEMRLGIHFKTQLLRTFGLCLESETIEHSVEQLGIERVV